MNNSWCLWGIFFNLIIEKSKTLITVLVPETEKAVRRDHFVMTWRRTKTEWLRCESSPLLSAHISRCLLPPRQFLTSPQKTVVTKSSSASCSQPSGLGATTTHLPGLWNCHSFGWGPASNRPVSFLASSPALAWAEALRSQKLALVGLPPSPQSLSWPTPPRGCSEPPACPTIPVVSSEQLLLPLFPPPWFTFLLC